MSLVVVVAAVASDVVVVRVGCDLAGAAACC